jgi:hydrogenase expression/formation protein HypC
MCLAIPAQIVEAAGNRARVALSGNIREADLSLIQDAGVGDWVLLHAGFAIERLSAEEAREALDLITGIEKDAPTTGES